MAATCRVEQKLWERHPHQQKNLEVLPRAWKTGPPMLSAERGTKALCDKASPTVPPANGVGLIRAGHGPTGSGKVFE